MPIIDNILIIPYGPKWYRPIWLWAEIDMGRNCYGPKCPVTCRSSMKAMNGCRDEICRATNNFSLPEAQRGVNPYYFALLSANGIINNCESKIH